MLLDDLKQFNLPELEKKVLAFWKENRIFEKSVALRSFGAAQDKRALASGKSAAGRQGGKPKVFRFFEGPPTANGRPGIHHVLARAFKDIIPRYKTMRGYYAPRRAGWDTHGLPVEIQVEKDLGLKSKKEIEAYGIAAFNKKCKESVWRYKDEWEKLTERIGYWLDLKNPYITYENSYIETLWWIFSEIAKRKLLYKGRRVVPWCTRCGTGLSSHELAQGYAKVKENSVYLKFRLKKGQKIGKDFAVDAKTFILSWTTTPWTLPGNAALAVGENFSYLGVKAGGETVIVAESRKEAVVGKEGEIVFKVKGKDLVGLKYEPLFKIPPLAKPAAHKIYTASFVTTTDGTGVVHTAVMYGEDDYKLGVALGLPEHHTVDERGKFTKDVAELAGMYAKDKKTEEKIISILAKEGFLLKTEPYEHDYPFCWRCGTALIYYARTSWFIAMSKLKRGLIRENQKINWIPQHIKAGRFGEWLKDLKDWAISRERYWGTPLPIWECGGCGHTRVIGGFEELNGLLGRSNNTYFLMRHGQAVNNAKNLSNSDPKKKDLYPLTPKGRIAAEATAKKLKKAGINLIFASDFRRTKETASIAAESLGLKAPRLDKRLREIHNGIYDGDIRAYHAALATYEDKLVKRPEGGENLRDVALRMKDFIFECENNYRGKNILIVSHEYPLWMLETVMRAWDEPQLILAKTEANDRGSDFISVAEAREVPYVKFPRDEVGFGDPHRPYVDECVFACAQCGKKMKRVKEVADVWFDSGAMPFAQAHYPFAFAQNKKSPPKAERTRSQKFLYPADYISEAMDQTRGWFYTLLAISNLLGKDAPYKNVISLGHILDKNGQKMSKSKGNVVDPWQMAEKYGIDVVRWHFYSMNEPGDYKNFDEADLGRTYRRFHALYYNSLVFLKIYAKGNLSGAKGKATNILDRWILSNLSMVIKIVTEALDRYDIVRAARTIESFVDDLSHWYIRRSRKRFSDPESKSDFVSAGKTLHEVLVGLAKLSAPFIPFFSEVIWDALGDKSQPSVHLADWPEASVAAVDKRLMEAMDEARKISSIALAKRAEAGIKVRQPLMALKIKQQNSKVKNNHELLRIIKDEVNVKEIFFFSERGSAPHEDAQIEVELDTQITPELYEEGVMRELARAVQKVRQDAGLDIGDKIFLRLVLPAELKAVVQKNEAAFKKAIKAREIKLLDPQEQLAGVSFDAEADAALNEARIKISLRKIR